MKTTAAQKLKSLLGEEVEIETEVDEDSGHDTRFYILLVAQTESG